MSDNINFDYKNLSPFKWFVLENFPFIEADFDALTEWQLFCKIGKEINKIITSLNLTGEQVETLTNAFNALKIYVDNYFNNLDVQEEINNKLNEMAESGELAEIINNYTVKCLGIFEDINDLKNSDYLVEGMFVKTIQYNLEYKSGGSYYKIIQKNNQVIDEMEYIELNKNTELIAQYIPQNDIISIADFGARPSLTDNSEIIKKVINYALTNNLKVIIPVGKFNITNDLGSYNNLQMEGISFGKYEDNVSCIIDNRIKAVNYLLELTGNSCYIRNLTFNGKNINNCLKIDGGWKSRFENLYIYRFLEALHVTGNDIWFNNILINDCGATTTDTNKIYAIYDEGLEDIYTNIHIEHCRFFMYTKNATTITNSKFEISTNKIDFKSSDSYFDINNSIFSNNEVIMLLLQEYTLGNHGFTNSTAPYCITANKTVITSNIFITGRGSGGHPSEYGLNTAKFLNTSECNISDNKFDSITKLVSAINCNNGIFTNNILYYQKEDFNVAPNIINSKNLLNKYIPVGTTQKLLPWAENPDTSIEYYLNNGPISHNTSLNIQLPGSGFFIGGMRIDGNSYDILLTYVISRANNMSKVQILSSVGDYSSLGITLNVEGENLVVSCTDERTFQVVNRMKDFGKLW